MTVAGLGDRVFVITGGASGIGLATAELLVHGGGRVAIVDVDAVAVGSAVAAFGADVCHGVVADVSREPDVAAAFEQAASRFGHIDGLLNNAGIEGPAAPLDQVSAEAFDRVVSVNFRGVFLVLREMLRGLKRQAGTGAIVNTASQLGLRGAPSLGAYAATKAAVISLTKTAAIEAGPRGVRVNALLPGPIDTPLMAKVPGDVLARLAGKVPLGRIGLPREAAAVAAWLLSPDSGFVSGGIYAVDGGESAC